MRIKRKNGLKIAAITIALLLCLALAVGITGALYQAKRQATGTLSMDQGIIIDYKGFGKTPDEGIWSRETTTTFLLFDETNAQPGQNIPVNAAGIRANEKSVNFYARVKLEYKFYNNGTEVTTLPNASDLITTSGNFFGANWVDGGGADGYYYYATGSTLNKFEKGTQTFVDLFATDAKFIIEGDGFTGADNNGESGGFKIDETTSINKIEVYLTLETLQGDATAEQAKALGWKIAQTVDFAKVKDNATFVQTGNYSEGAAVTNYTDTAEIEEMQNVEVKIDDKVSTLNAIKFPYGTTTTLEIASPNIEYIQLKYKDGTNADGSDKYKLSEQFYDTQETGNAKITVTADENEEVGGYVVGWFSSKEYTGFVYSKHDFSKQTKDDIISGKEPDLQQNNCVSILKYFGNEKNITINEKARVRQRNFEVVLTAKDLNSFFKGEMLNYYNYFTNYWLWSEMLPITIVETGNSYETITDLINAYWELPTEIRQTTITLKGKIYVETKNILYSENIITQINPCTFSVIPLEFVGESIAIPGSIELLSSNFGEEYYSIFGVVNFRDADNLWNKSIKSITLGEGILVLPTLVFSGLTKLEEISLPESLTSLEEYAFCDCTALKSITIPQNVKSIGSGTFRNCSNLTTTVGDIGGNWVEASDNSAVDANTFLKNISYDIKKV